MKRIEAIIRPECVARVRAALTELSYRGLTVSEVKGHGAQKGGGNSGAGAVNRTILSLGG